MRKIHNHVNFVLETLKLLILYPLAICMPRNNKKILFGAWWGKQFSDNPKYFLKFLIQHNASYEYYWFGDKNLREAIDEMPSIHFVERGSLKAIWHVLTARWAMWTIGFEEDISEFPTFGRIKQLSFWHGPGFKGVAHPNYNQENILTKNFKQRIVNALIRFHHYAKRQKAFASFSTSKMVEYMQYEAPCLFCPEQSRAFGTARIDYLINNRDNSGEIRRLKEKYAKKLNLPSDKKVVSLYADLA